MKFILTTYRITDTLHSYGYYNLSDSNYEKLMKWYDEYIESNEEYYINEQLHLSLDNFTVSVIDDNEQFQEFLNKYGNPCNILEQIDDLDFFDEEIKNDSDSEDSMLYTETVNRLITAYIDENKDEVENILNNNEFDEEDDIINKIKDTKIK